MKTLNHFFKGSFVLHQFYFQNEMATLKDDQCVQRVGNESHLSHLSSGLNQLRQQATFCDVNIIVGDQRFPAHKAVLSSASDYFQGMFTSGFQESTVSEVTVPGTKESFAQILEFAYTGYFTLSLQNVSNILKMACYMVFTEAVKKCADYLRKFKKNFTIELEDCFEMWSIASNHDGLSDIAEMYRSHMLQNFSKPVKSGSFLGHSSASVMMDFLSDEEIESDDMTEEQILQAALIWLNYDWEQRKVHAADILKKIRLGLVPLDRLKEILGDELRNIPECKDMVEKVVKLSVTKETASPPLLISHTDLFASRNTITAKLESRGSSFKTHDASRLSPSPIVSLACRTKTACYKMSKLADIPHRYPYPDERFASVEVVVSRKNELYAVVEIESSPHDEEDAANHFKWLSENNFFQYIPETNVWTVFPRAPKQLYTYSAEIFQLEEYLYYIGESGDHGHSSILRFCIFSKSWEILMDDILLAVHSSIQLSTGLILLKGRQVRAGSISPDGHSHSVNGNAVALYKPATNDLLDVSVDGTLDISSFFVEYDNKYFQLTRSFDEAQVDQVNRLICDLDTYPPTMQIAEATKDETLAVIQNVDTDFCPEFTFDKRKLGLVPGVGSSTLQV